MSGVVCVVVFFFFKQKTAYEMRISDWSSDVCSSDLRRGIKVIADAKPEEAGLVRSYGADVVVERGPDFADAVRREVPEGVDALLDTALLAETSFGAIRDGGVSLPVRGWGDKPAERGIEIRPVFVFEVLERTDWLARLLKMRSEGRRAGK